MKNLLMSFALLFSASALYSQTCVMGDIMTGTLTNTRAVCTPFASAISPFSGSTPGLVPSSQGGTTNFLRSDGTWVAPAGISYPATAGLAYFDGTEWGTSYTTSGTGTTVALTGGPTFTTVTANSYIGQFSPVYGTIVLGSGSGATIEKTISDATAVIVASENTATTGTGDFFDTKDSGGTLHTVIDHSLGMHASTFNGIALTTSGLASSFLSGAGTYQPISGVIGFPITLGSTSIAANSTNTALSGLTALQLAGPPATADQNFNSGSLTLTGSFYDLGPTQQSWTVENLIGMGSTPTSTFSIIPIAGGTTGSHLFQVSADEATLQNGSSRVDITGSDAFLGVGGVGIDVTSSDVTIDANSASGNIDLYPGTTGVVRSNAPVVAPVVSFISGGSQININAPVGGSGTFNQNATAENGDIDVCPTGTPTITIGAGSGTGATSNIIGDNCGGVVTITTGSSTVSQALIFTLNFSSQFTHYGFCTFAPMRVTLQDAGITPDNVYMDTGYSDHFALGLSGTGTMEALSNHQWSYTCNGY